MREADVKPTVLIVDEDLGFVCSLGEILSNQGFQTIPALDSRSAMAIVEELNRQVNLVIVDPTRRSRNDRGSQSPRPFPKDCRHRRPGQGCAWSDPRPRYAGAAFGFRFGSSSGVPEKRSQGAEEPRDSGLNLTKAAI